MALTQTDKYAFKAFYSLIALFGVTLYAIVIFALKRTRQLGKIALQLVFWLSVNDCLVYLFDVPAWNWCLHHEEDKIAIIVNFVTAQIFGHMSTIIIMVLAVYRMLHFKYPLTFNERRTKKYVRNCSAGLVTFIVLVAIFGALQFHSEEYHDVVYVPWDIMITGIYVLQLVIFLFVGFYALFLMRRMRQRATTESTMKAAQKSTRVFLGIFVCALICYVPSVLLSQLVERLLNTTSMSQGELRVFSIVRIVVHDTLPWSNGLVNAVICLRMNSKLFKYFKEKFIAVTEVTKSTNPTVIKQSRSREETLQMQSIKRAADARNKIESMTRKVMIAETSF